MLLAEHAIAARRPGIVQARAEVFAGIADATGHDDAGRLADARLHACIADAAGNWEALARMAKRMYPGRVAALLLARHGRYLALTQEPEAAIERFNDAIEQACDAGTFADAADWQFAIRDIRISYGVGTLADLDDPYRLALASRAAGDDSVIPSPFSPLDLALSDLVDRQLPDALAALRRYRRRSVTLADWRAEREAGTRLGDVYATAGEPATAVRHYITSGNTDRLKDLAQRLPEEALPLPVPDDLAELPPWERAAYFTIAGSAADLLTDSEAAAWAAVTLAELMATTPAPALAASPSLEACNAFGHLADAATPEQARQFLDHADPWVEREPNHYRHTDPAHAEALVRIAGAHPDLRRDAVDQMCRALLADQRMAGIVLSDGPNQLRAEPAVVASQCGPAAAGGNFYAALALIVAGAGSADAIPVAQAALGAVTRPKTAASGGIEYAGGWQEAATLTCALDPADRARLAEAMAAVITDPDQPAWNKREALAALATAGRHLTDDDRNRFFPVAFRAAGGDIAGSDDGPFPRGQLSRARMITEDATLRYVGLLAAAALAYAPDQFESVIDLAYELMPNASTQEAHRVARALTLLPADGRALLDPRSLAGHESEWIRSAAAALWCTASGRPAQVGHRLAADPSRHVRRALASHLPDRPEYEDLRARLRNDIRRSVRTVLHAAG